MVSVTKEQIARALIDQKYKWDLLEPEYSVYKDFSLNADRFISKITGDNMISTAGGNIVQTYSGSRYSLDVDFDTAVWRIECPGIVREDIQVFTVAEILYVDVSGRDRMQFNLDKDEKVTETKLELGVLSITIDRPAKRISIEVA